MVTAPQAPQRWLFGPAIDLLLGCGFGYAFVFVALTFWGRDLQTVVTAGFMPLLLLLASAAHYGATLLRVYERSADRNAYRVFTVWATIVIALLCYASLHEHLLGRLLVTLYLAWSPWHYAGQNYGLALMFLRRRGVEVTPRTKRIFHASFVLSVALTLIGSHGVRPVLPNAGEPSVLPNVFEMISLGIPFSAQVLLYAAGLLAYLGLLLASIVLLLRKGSLRDLLPAAALAATQSLWFVVPITAGIFRFGQDVFTLSLSETTYVFFFIATGHAVQYLWITAYYARSSARERKVAPYLLKCLLAGNAIWGVPALLFSPRLLGSIAYEDGLFLLIAAGVNLHHFVLDGAIWKLRDSKIARVLIRSEPSSAPVEPETRRGWLAPTIFATGALCLAASAAGTWEREAGLRQAGIRGDRARVESALTRLRWLGREDANAVVFTASLASQHGEIDTALERAERSLEMRRHPRSLHFAGRMLEEKGRIEEAVAHYAEARELAPRDLLVLQHLGRGLRLLGRNREALEVYEAAAVLFPEEPELQADLQRTRALIDGTRSSRDG